MSRSNSPLRDRMIFNVGVRRSGTFWLQRIVTTHPEVASIPSETTLFSHGIAPLFERFTHGLKGNPEVAQMWVDRDVLLDAARDFCDRVFEGHLEKGASRLAERTPVHVAHVGLIAEIYPDARVVHIIRDGRDVARSLVAKSWGPDTIEEAATEWRDAIVAARAGKVEGRYTEVRYEDLMVEPEREVRRIFAALELEVTEERVADAVAEAKVEVNVDLRTQTVGKEKWRTALSEEELAGFDEIGGELLADLGYPPSREGRLRAAIGRVGARRGERPAKPVLSDGKHARVAVALLDDLLTAIGTDRRSDVTGALAPDAVFEHVRDGKRSVTAGAGAREALLVAVSGDEAMSGRQRASELYHHPSGVIGVVDYELSSGLSAERLLLLTARDGQIARLVIYEMPVA